MLLAFCMHLNTFKSPRNFFKALCVLMTMQQSRKHLVSVLAFSIQYKFAKKAPSNESVSSLNDPCVCLHPFEFLNLYIVLPSSENLLHPELSGYSAELTHLASESELVKRSFPELCICKLLNSSIFSGLFMQKNLFPALKNLLKYIFVLSFCFLKHAKLFKALKNFVQSAHSQSSYEFALQNPRLALIQSMQLQFLER